MNDLSDVLSDPDNLSDKKVCPMSDDSFRESDRTTNPSDGQKHVGQKAFKAQNHQKMNTLKHSDNLDQRNAFASMTGIAVHALDVGDLIRWLRRRGLSVERRILRPGCCRVWLIMAESKDMAKDGQKGIGKSPMAIFAHHGQITPFD